MLSIFDAMKDQTALREHIEPLVKEWLNACVPDIRKLPLDYQTAQLNGFLLSSIAISTKRMADAMDRIAANLEAKGEAVKP